MEVDVTVIDPDGSGVGVDLTVSAPAGTTTAQLRPAVLAACGAEPGARLVLGSGEPLSDEAALGAPPLVRGAVLALDRAAGPRAPWSRAPALLALHVVTGPDAGGVLPLAPGDHVLGRTGRADLRIEDPRISREHADLRVGVEGVRVRDRCSANGTALDGAPLGTGWVELALGSRLRLGSTVVVLRRPDGARLPTSVRDDGRLAVHPRRRHVAPSTTVTLELPPEPVGAPLPRWQLLGVLLPLAAALAMAVLWSPVALLFGLTTPVLALGTTAGERRTTRRRSASALADHALRCEEVRARAQAVLAREAEALEERFPDLPAVLTTACGPGPRLWERRGDDEDVLSLRLGSGAVPSSTTLATGGAPSSPAERLQHRLAPVVARLAEIGVLGVSGPAGARRALARSLVGQAAVLHAPSALQVRVLTDAPHHWAWVRWLPHAPSGVSTDVADALRGLSGAVGARPGSAEPARPRVLLVVDLDEHSSGSAALRQLLAEGPPPATVIVWASERADQLPGPCRATVEVLAPGSQGLRWSTGAEVVDALPALAPPAWADRLARSLAPLHDAGARGSLPEGVRLLDLLGEQGLDATDPGAVARAWDRRPRTTRIVLGRTATGPWHVDLRRDGPHVLVAGTTGAGKSELLTAMVVSLAAVNRPDELSLLLVDYKGGAAFAAVAELPHTAGVVTDLDPHLTSRALASLRAEVRRRERLLADCGCRDVEALEALRDSGAPVPGLARLVIVVDELRVLAEELPEFVDGLVRLAAVGRSLGVHLVLATQRPAGVVSADVRANTNLRIALRVRDPADSTDVVDAPDAAALTADRPGRALTRTGGGPLVPVQAAWVSAAATEDDPDPRGVRVRRSDATPRVPTGPDDVQRVLAAVRAAAAGIPRAPRPWLEPLPARVRRADLPRPSPGPAPPGLVLGWTDEPARQRRTPLTWSLQEPLLVCGGPRSGRTTTLRCVAAAATELSPAALHLYAVGGTGTDLDALAGLPHTGAVTSWREPERLLRVLRHVAATTAGRQRNAPSSTPAPRVVLLVDDASRWLDESHPAATADAEEAVGLLQQLLLEGPAVGVFAVLTGDRRLLTGRWGSTSGERLLLTTPDPTDFLLAGVPVGDVPTWMPPGRALHRGPGGVHESQVAVLGEEAAGEDAAFGSLAAACALRWSTVPADLLPVALPPLPTRLDAQGLDEALASGQADPRADQQAGNPVEPRRWSVGSLPLGIGGDAVAPVSLDLAQTPAALIAGPPGAGRSSTLLALGQRLHAEGLAVVVVAARRSVLTTRAVQLGWPLCAPSSPSPGPLGCLLGEGDPRPVAALVDDAEQLGPGAVHDALEHHLAALDRGARRGALLVAGSPGELLVTYRGLVPSLRRARTGLLLHPVPAGGGDLLGIPTPRASPGPPGRATLVLQGRASTLQLALPRPDGAPP